MPDTDSPGFQIEYPAITLHAISRSESGLSIYCQLDETLGNASCLIGDSNGQDEDEKGDAQMRELIIVPQHPDSGTFDISFLFLILFALSRENIRCAFSMCISPS